MRRPVRWPAGLAAILAMACAPPEAVVDEAAEVEALAAVAEAYHAAAAALDADAVSAFYAADAVMYPPELAAVRGIEAVREYAAGFTSAPGIEIAFELTEAVISGDASMGYTMGVGKSVFDGPDGEPVTESLRDFHVWVKDAAGEWKLVVDIWNSPDPPADGDD